MRTGRFWVLEFLTMVDDIAVSAFSNWGLVSFSRQWPKFFEGGRMLPWKTVSTRIGSCEMWYNCSIIWWVCLVDFQMRSCMSFQTVAWIVWEWPGSVVRNSDRIDNCRVRRRIHSKSRWRLPSKYLRKTAGSRFTCFNSMGHLDTFQTEIPRGHRDGWDSDTSYYPKREQNPHPLG